MTNRRKALWAVAAVMTLLVVTAISIPNLLRSRKVDQSVSFSTGRTTEQQGAGGGGGGHKIAVYAQLVAPDKKLIHNAELELVVGDVRAAAEQIRKLVDLNHGEIDKLEIRDATGGSVSATLVVRVPASGLENALAEFKKVAVRTEREQVSTRDVSRDFYDNEAHMRNLRAEEQQYLDPHQTAFDRLVDTDSGGDSVGCMAERPLGLVAIPETEARTESAIN